MARRLLGDPPRIGADEWRYGSRGSLAVHPARGTWHDFEADAGGGVLDLVQHVNGCDRAGALRYLVDARLIAAPAGADSRPANRVKPCHNAARVSAPYRTIADRVPAPTAAVARAVLAAADRWWCTRRTRRAVPGMVGMAVCYRSMQAPAPACWPNRPNPGSTWVPPCSREAV